MTSGGVEAIFGIAARDQRPRMDTPLLAETVDAADALLAAVGGPGLVDFDDEAAACLQVEPLGGDVGGEEVLNRAGREGGELRLPLRRRLQAVQVPERVTGP